MTAVVLQDERYLTTLMRHFSHLRSLRRSIKLYSPQLDGLISSGESTVSELLTSFEAAAQACRRHIPSVDFECDLLLGNELYSVWESDHFSDAELLALNAMQFDDDYNVISYRAKSTASPYAWHGLDLTVVDSGCFRYEELTDFIAERGEEDDEYAKVAK